MCISQGADARSCVTGCAVAQFAAQQRRKAQQLTEQKTVERLLAIRLLHGGGQSRARQRIGVVLILRRRHAVEQAGQHLPLAR